MSSSRVRPLRAEDASAVAPVPDGIQIRPYRHAEDEQRVYEATQEAFADQPELDDGGSMELQEQ